MSCEILSKSNDGNKKSNDGSKNAPVIRLDTSPVKRNSLGCMHRRPMPRIGLAMNRNVWCTCTRIGQHVAVILQSHEHVYAVATSAEFLSMNCRMYKSAEAFESCTTESGDNPNSEE